MMKIVVSFILSATFLYATPVWFYNIKVSQKNEIIGYGIGESLVKARQQATASVVETISVEIDSSLDIATSSSNGNIYKKASMNISSQAHATLSGIKVIRSVKIDENWYVAVKYDNSPLEIRLKKLLPKELKGSDQNLYLKNTPLIRNLNTEINVSLDYEIIRKDNLWQLQYHDIIIPLTQDDFYLLFSNVKSAKISITANKSVYREKDTMKFEIKHSQPGYISVLYVEHNGKVGVLFSNLVSEKHLIYPSAESEDTFVISNPYKEPIKELYIALYSKEPIDLSMFEEVTSTVLDKTNYNFDRLLFVLNNVVFSSYQIKIK